MQVTGLRLQVNIILQPATCNLQQNLITMKKLLLILGVFALLASCQTKQNDITPEEQEEIAKIIRSNVQFMVDSLTLNNQATFEKQLETWAETNDKAWVGEPAMWLNMMYLFPSKESIRETWDPSRVSRQKTNMKIDEDYIAVLSRESALYVFKGVFSITDKDGITGVEIPMSGTYVFVLRDGEWKTIHNHQSWKQ